MYNVSIVSLCHSEPDVVRTTLYLPTLPGTWLVREMVAIYMTSSQPLSGTYSLGGRERARQQDINLTRTNIAGSAAPLGAAPACHVTPGLRAEGHVLGGLDQWESCVVYTLRPNDSAGSCSGG